MWDDRPFEGAKIALIHGSDLLAYLRDDKPGIPFPGLWDLPGGGREGDESPAACALREVEEEFGLVIDPARIVWTRCYASQKDAASGHYFLVADITSAEIAAIIVGSEGQRWELMSIDTFLRHPEVIAPLKTLASGRPRSTGGGTEISP